MTFEEALQSLSLDPTVSPAAARRAYFKATRSLEHDAEGLERARQAYSVVAETLAWRGPAAARAGEDSAAAPPPTTPGSPAAIDGVDPERLERLRALSGADADAYGAELQWAFGRHPDVGPLWRLYDALMDHQGERDGDPRDAAIALAVLRFARAAGYESFLPSIAGNHTDRVHESELRAATRSSDPNIRLTAAAGLARRGAIDAAINVVCRLAASPPRGGMAPAAVLVEVVAWAAIHGAVHTARTAVEAFEPWLQRPAAGLEPPSDAATRYSTLARELTALPDDFPVTIAAILGTALRDRDLDRARAELATLAREDAATAQAARAALEAHATRWRAELEPALHAVPAAASAPPPDIARRLPALVIPGIVVVALTGLIAAARACGA